MNPFKRGMIGGTYVINAKSFTDRAAHIKAQLDNLDIPFEFILPYDADALKPEDVKVFSQQGPQMPKGKLSCTLKHLEALKRIVAGEFRYGLILEDDAILEPPFMTELEKVLEETKSLTNLHVIYLGLGSNMFVPWRKLRKGRRLYEANVSRCAEAYLIGAPAARARLAWLEQHQTDRPVDHMFTQIDREMGITMYWANPATVVQGSMNGFYFSTQEGGTQLAKLWQFKMRFKFQQFRRKYIYRFFQ